jgi:hypothetical protein
MTSEGGRKGCSHEETEEEKLSALRADMHARSACRT